MNTSSKQAASCAICRTTGGKRYPNDWPIRIQAARFGLPGLLCYHCAVRLYAIDKRIEPFAPDPVPDGLTGDTEREQKRIQRRTAIVRDRLVIPRYERQRAKGRGVPAPSPPTVVGIRHS